MKIPTHLPYHRLYAELHHQGKKCSEVFSIWCRREGSLGLSLPWLLNLLEAAPSGCLISVLPKGEAAPSWPVKTPETQRLDGFEHSQSSVS